MDKHRQSKITRGWMTLVAAAVITLGPSGVAQAQAILYGAAHTLQGASTLYTINPATGAATAVGTGIGFNACSGMDFHPETGVLYATCFRPTDPRTVLITIDPATGAGTEVNPTGLGIPSNVSDISFRNSDQVLYAYLVAGTRGDQVGQIDLTTGAVTQVVQSQVDQFGNGLAFSPTDVLFHAATVTPGGTDGVLNTLDQDIGRATFVTSLSFPDCGAEGFPRINAMDFQPGTTTLFGALNAGGSGFGPNCLVTINTTTGVVTLIAETVSGLDALAWSQPAVETAAHFECYKAEGRKVRETVTLEDQFGTKSRVRVRRPELFCTPASKNGEGIKNPAGHLTCYEIKDGEDDEKRRVRVKNQFGERTLKVHEAKLLCVASEQLSVVEGGGDDDHDDHEDQDHDKD